MQTIHNSRPYRKLVGKLAKLTEFGVELEKTYREIFGGGYEEATMLRLYHFCNDQNLKLMFLDEVPMVKHGVTWYCLRLVGRGSNDDWFWLTLNQVVVCDE